MSLNPLVAQVDPMTRRALIRQADALGFQTENQWCAVILKTLATLPPERALVALGKIHVISKGTPRIAGLNT